MIKRIFCSYCGRQIFTFTIGIEERAHIQKVVISGACELCSKSTSTDFEVGELDPARVARREAAMKEMLEVKREQDAMRIAAEGRQ